MLRPRELLGILAVFCYVFGIASSAEEVNPSDLIEGKLTDGSVLIYSDHFIGPGPFLWRGENLITRFEIRQTNFDPHPTSSRPALRVLAGGLQTDHLQLGATDQHTAALDIHVRIFSEPNHQRFGQVSANTFLANASYIAGRAPLELNYAGEAIVRAVHLLDQTNGTGAYVAYIDGIGTRAVYIQFRSRLPAGRMDFRMEFHGDRPFRGYETYHVGRMLESSVELEFRWIDEKNGDIDADGWFVYRLPADYRIDYARLTDHSAGECDRVLDAYIRTDDTLRVHFGRWRHCVRFRLEVYGWWGSEWKVIVGERHEDSVLLHREVVDTVGVRETCAFQTRAPIDRLEVVNLDQEKGVRALVVEGEVGGRVVVVMFEAAEPVRMHFEVVVYGRP